MNILSDNPYRILGVFANDPIRVRTANIAKIRAFKKVGKECTFACDFTDIFGPVNRSDEAIEQAISHLSSDNDAKFYSCFWVNHTSKLNGSENTAIDIIRSGIEGDDKPSCINVAVGALVASNNSLAARYYVRLFDEDDTLSDTIKERVLDALNECRYTAEIELPYEWWHLLWDACTQKPAQGATVDLIRRFFNKSSIRFIRDLSKDGLPNCEKTIRGLKTYHYGWVKRAIDVACETSDVQTHQPNAEAQIALSEYADVVLGISKDIYSNSHFWDAKPVEDLLVLLRDIFRIAYSNSVKDACADFGKMLKKEANYLAPPQLHSQSAAIRKQIELFCEKPNEAKWALELVRNCVPALIDIKSAVGVDDLFYRRISTRIADNALYACSVELSSAKRKYENPNNDRAAAASYLASVMQRSWQLLVNLEQLDVEDEFAGDKLNGFAAEISQGIENYSDIKVEKPVPTVALVTQEELFNDCADYNSLCDFILAYPNGPFIKEAMQRKWAIEDKSLPQFGASIQAYVQALFAYKRKFPCSHNDNKLLKELDDFLLNPKTLGSVSDYNTLLQLWPNHPKKAVILGRIDLASFKECRSLAEWKSYLRKFPNGNYRAEAQRLIDEATQRIEKQAFEKCVTIAELNSFILRHPQSVYATDAMAKIEYLVYTEVRVNGNHDAYYKRYPNGRYVNELRKLDDDRLFKRCKAKSDYKHYLDSFPNGDHAEEVRKILAKKQKKKKLTIICLSACFLILSVATLGIIANTPNSHMTSDVSDYSSETQAESDNVIEQPQSGDYHDEESSDDYEYEYNGNASEYDSEDDHNYSEEIELPSERIDAAVRAAQSRHLDTWDTPYASQLGRAKTGSNYLRFFTSKGCDYIIIVKDSASDEYMNHVYIRGGESAMLYLPDGTFNVFFYSGIGWDPNKRKGSLVGGFVSAESLQKDTPIDLYSAYCEYTLYPVANGNLTLKKANETEAF